MESVPSLIFSEGKIQIISVSGQGHNHCLLGLWRSDSCGWDAERQDNQLRRPHRDADRTQVASQAGSVSKQSKIKSCFNIKMQGRLNILETIKRMFLDSVTLSTPRPVSSTLRFPPIRSPEGCNPRCEVWIMMTMWFSQWDLDYVNKTKRGTDKADVTRSWLTQDLGSGRRLIGYGDKTSFLTL